MKNQSDFVYTGQENLEAMKFAVNYNKHLVSLITREIKDNPKAKVLDFGAGIGTYADLLMTDGYKADCLELDQGQIKMLKSKGYKVYDSIKSVSGKYDVIYALNVFEHIENDIDIFSELAAKLKPGGSIVIYVPAFQVLYSSMDKLVGHHRRYSLRRLRIMSERAHLSTTRLEYQEPAGYFASLLFKFFGNDKGVITPKSVKTYDTYAYPVSRMISPIFKKLLGKNALLVAKRSD